MRVLGIDPGFNATGYGILEQNQSKFKCIEVGTIEPNPKDFMEYRLESIHRLLDQVIVQHQPNVMVLEKLYAHAKHPATSFKLGHVRGVICLLCAKHKMELIEESPKRIRKSVTGNGNASKQQTKAMVGKILGIDESKLTLDASDALAMALGYMYMKRGI